MCPGRWSIGRCARAGWLLSPDQRDFAARLLPKAREDLAAVQALLDNDTISDDVIGFHAQQAVEKAMKSVLVVHGVAFRRAHDLRYLLQVAEDGNEKYGDDDAESAVATAMSAKSNLLPPRIGPSSAGARWLRSSRPARGALFGSRARATRRLTSTRSPSSRQAAGWACVLGPR